MALNPLRNCTRNARFLTKWHSILSLRRQEEAWYPARLREEQQELTEAPTKILRLSENADVYYIISRADHDQYPGREFDGVHLPPLKIGGKEGNAMIYGYMIGKYTSRWLFWRTAAAVARRTATVEKEGQRVSWDPVREVVNPGKDSKVLEVCSRHEGLDPHRFLTVCQRLRNAWPLLP